MDLQKNVNELITLRTNGVEDAMKSMKDIESLFDKVTSNYRPLLNGERYLSDVEVSHRLKVSRRTLQDYRDDNCLSPCRTNSQCPSSTSWHPPRHLSSM